MAGMPAEIGRSKPGDREPEGSGQALPLLVGLLSMKIVIILTLLKPKIFDRQQDIHLIKAGC
jgi:hypothetical protein